MNIGISYQDSYSRGQLLLRTLFGAIYIAIPHFFLLAFVSIWSSILAFATFWIALFTGGFPEGIFSFQLRYYRWMFRVSASMSNLVDNYPPLGLDKTMEGVDYEVDRPESVSRGSVLLRALFGALYVGIPHGVAVGFRGIGSAILMGLAWWVVLFTGKYPEKWHAFNVGTLRWEQRITLYLMYLTDEYPPFSGK